LRLQPLKYQPVVLCSRLNAVVIVPPASHSPTETAPEGSVLLIEEYDALAAAISSALRKFAPGHPVHVARNLAEATSLAKAIEPVLVVIDFDPAFAGLSAFLQNIQAGWPDTRALLLAGKLPAEVAKVTRSSGALQFIEKPFDVPDFGAAVQALLGPWRDPGTAISRGTLNELTLADLIAVQGAGGRTVVIDIRGGEGKSGEIHLRQGIPIHAEAGQKSGNDALGEMLDWSELQVVERERPRTTHRTIQSDWPQVMVEALLKVKPRPVRPAGKAAPAKSVKKLVVVDDTEMLLIFVEDVLSTSGGSYQITTAPNGISGVKEVARVKPDLVLLDYSLPDINGDEVCRRLLQSGATSRIPVLMMSGHVPEMAKAAASLDNVVATIEKPFLSDALVSLVQQVLTEERSVRKKSAPARGTKPATPAVPPPPSEPETAPMDEIPLTAEELPLQPDLPGVRSHEVEEPVEARAGGAAQPPSESVIGKARRAIGQLRKHIAPQEERPEIVEPEPVPSPVPPLAQDRPPEPVPLGPNGFSPTPVLSAGTNEVVLSLFLDVISVQLTPELRMGSIRAKPSSAEVSLYAVSSEARGALAQTAFKLGQAALDGLGRIATLRLIPSHVPVKPTPTQNALQIGAVTVVPIDSTSRMQLTPTPDAAMRLQLLAHLELTGVELSSTFQVSQIVLQDQGQPFRVMMTSQPPGQEENGAICETVAVELDYLARIRELLLNPVDR
jgi:DNA-binding response OmpR family regulator